MSLARTQEGPSGDAPKYQQLRDSLADLIANLPVGAMLPTERELCSTYSVSRSTVRAALGALEHEQRITRRQGKGTFVAQAKIVQSLELTSHTEGMRAQGIIPGSKLLDVRRVIAGAEVGAKLQVSPEAEVLRIERLRLADGDPIAIEAVFLDADRFDGITAALAQNQSLYQLLAAEYDITLASAEETIEVALATEREAALLSLWTGAPLLMFSRSTVDSTGQPIEFVKSLYRGDRFRFKTHLERPRDEGRPRVGVRGARRTDAPAMARVFADSWRAGYRGVVDDDIIDALDESELAEWLGSLIESGSLRTVVAVDGDGRVVGFVRFGHDPDDPRHGHVYGLYVHPDAAGTGVGSRLLGYAVDELEAGGPRPITLWVFESNERARALYERHGFSPDGSRRVEKEYRAQEIRLRRPPSSGGR